MREAPSSSPLPPPPRSDTVRRRRRGTLEKFLQRPLTPLHPPPHTLEALQREEDGEGWGRRERGAAKLEIPTEKGEGGGGGEGKGTKKGDGFANNVSHAVSAVSDEKWWVIFSVAARGGVTAAAAAG